MPSYRPLAANNNRPQLFFYARVLLLICFLSTNNLLAQVPVNPIGLNPSHLRWNQIKTDKVQVIFPKGMEASGQRVTNLVHYLWDHDTESVGDKKGKVTILLQNQGVLSNGLVTVGPFRSEFYTTPPQFDCTTDWLYSLTTHEYRHVQQFINARKGITGLTRYVLGSWAYGGLMGTALPRWYFEGDAVGVETAFSKSGRGRLPAFNMEYRALRLSGRHYNYEKAAGGSYKDFVPDWYSLGYYLISYGRERFGEAIWQTTTDDAVRYRGLFFPFSNNLKKRTGLNTPALYRASMAYLDSLYQPKNQSSLRQETTIIHKSKHPSLTSYFNPQPLEDGQVLVEKRPLHQWPAYYLVQSDGQEKKVAMAGVIGGQLNTTLSQAKGQICWAERAYDLRWGNRDYSIIKVHDLQTGKTKKITTKSRYFAPALSPAADRIVAVEVDKNGQSFLVILDRQNGAIIQQLKNPGAYFYSFPRWTSDGEHLIVVAKKAEQHQLQLISLSSGEMKALSPATSSQLTHPFPHQGRVYFSAAYKGVNQIFSVDLQGEQMNQWSEAAYGAFQPAVSSDGQNLYYSSFTADGYQIESIPLDEAKAKPYTPAAPIIPFPFVQTLIDQGGSSLVNEVPTTEFPVKKYRELSGLIQPHSILPYLYPPLMGATILSDNKFSTLSATASAFYNLNDRDWTFSGNLSYARLFPILNGGVSYSNRSSVQRNFSIENDSTFTFNAYIAEWEERRIVGGVEIPFNLSAGRFFNRLRLRTNWQYIDIDNDDSQRTDPNNFRDTTIVSGQLNTEAPIFRKPMQSGQANALDSRLSFISLQRLAPQHIRFRLGLIFEMRYRHLLKNDHFDGDVFSLRGDVYLPGIGPNHSILINTLYQKQDELDNYRFSNFFVSPRGYSGLSRSELRKVGFNYSLPLAYPDIAIGPLAYIKRIKANVFYDFAQASSEFFRSVNYQSTGIELNVDFRALRLVEMDVGVRYSYLSNPNAGLNPGSRHQFEFLLISITQ